MKCSEKEAMELRRVYDAVCTAHDALEEIRPGGGWLSESEELVCDECGAVMYLHHKFCWQCGEDYRKESEK